MRVLALDTTTAAGSVALAGDTGVLDIAAIDPSQPIATRLPVDLIAMLERHRIDLRQIDLFAVATGPGSFTGLRIGIATMQGLALAHHRPLAGVAAFHALASFADAPRVDVWIDAWRGEVYAASFAGDASPSTARRPIGEPTVDTPDALLHDRAPSGETMFIGDGAVRYQDRLPRVIAPTPLLAGAIATIAMAHAAAGEWPPPHAIRPLYVRRPDAELARDRR